MTADLEKLDDADLCAFLAQGTGRILTSVREAGLLSGSELGKAGDQLAQNWIARVLHNYRPDDQVLSEEAEDSRRRLGEHRVWIIDPLDGTKEYASERFDWAVHIALSVDGEITHAAVGMPGLHKVFNAEDYRRGIAIADWGLPTNNVVISSNSVPQIAVDVARDLDMNVTRLGSCGAKAISVLLGDNDAYIHAGGQYEWDNAAPVGVALAAGLHCSRLDGSPLVYNAEDTFLPDILVCRPELAEPMLASLKKFL